jgi:Tol biopolymer transport system component
LIGTASGGVYRVAAAGGVAKAITQLDVARQEGSHRWPRFLPDGRHFLFTVRSGAADQRGIYVGSVDGDVKQLVLRSDASVAYAGGHMLFLEGDTLLARPFETRRFELTGPPVVIAAKVGRSSNGNAAFSVSTAGTLVYAETILQLGRLEWFSRTGDSVGSAGREGDHDYSDFRLSPDETRLAASIVDPTLGVPDIWMTDLARGGTTRFTFGPAVNAGAVWSPDGERIIFRTNRKGLIELYQKNAATSGNEEPVLLEEMERASGLASTNLLATDWSPDGRSVVFSGSMPADLWVLPLSDQAKPVHSLRSSGEQWHANVSPDGRFVAYTSNESGRFEVYVRTFPAFDRPQVISTKGGYEPRWRGDSRELYYLSQDRNLMAVSVGTGLTPVFGVSQALFQTQVHEGVHALRTRYVPSRDGRRFLIQTRSVTPAPVSLSVVLNWTAALKQ